MEYTLPIEVQQFVRTHIRSLDQLEVLSLVSALPDRAWSIDDVYRIVLSTREMVRKRLDDFVAAGLLSRAEGAAVYRYRPNSDELARQVSALIAAYKVSRHRIVELIYPRSSGAGPDFPAFPASSQTDEKTVRMPDPGGAASFD